MNSYSRHATHAKNHEHFSVDYTNMRPGAKKHSCSPSSVWVSSHLECIVTEDMATGTTYDQTFKSVRPSWPLFITASFPGPPNSSSLVFILHMSSLFYSRPEDVMVDAKQKGLKQRVSSSWDMNVRKWVSQFWIQHKKIAHTDRLIKYSSNVKCAPAC